MHSHLNTDAVVACADLAGRAGATDFEIGWVHDDVPAEEAGWYAHVRYRGARLTVDDRRSPSEAALALAERILAGGTCRCGKVVTLADGGSGCRWRLVGKRWESGCDAQSVFVPEGGRGDVAKMRQAIGAAVANRADRRKAKRRNG